MYVQCKINISMIQKLSVSDAKIFCVYKSRTEFIVFIVYKTDYEKIVALQLKR